MPRTTSCFEKNGCAPVAGVIVGRRCSRQRVRSRGWAASAPSRLSKFVCALSEERIAGSTCARAACPRLAATSGAVEMSGTSRGGIGRAYIQWSRTPGLQEPEPPRDALNTRRGRRSEVDVSTTSDLLLFNTTRRARARAPSGPPSTGAAIAWTDHQPTHHGTPRFHSVQESRV